MDPRETLRGRPANRRRASDAAAGGQAIQKCRISHAEPPSAHSEAGDVGGVRGPLVRPYLTLVTTVAVLLLPTGSGVLELTIAVLVIVACFSASTFTVIVTAPLAPSASAPR